MRQFLSTQAESLEPMSQHEQAINDVIEKADRHIRSLDRIATDCDHETWYRPTDPSDPIDVAVCEVRNTLFADVGVLMLCRYCNNFIHLFVLNLFG